ncbi:MAG: DUF2156 domain-containing protein [Clostridia bacterium]|nr:DUF2156 domain-containing protein [Clostridia bacterium]
MFDFKIPDLSDSEWVRECFLKSGTVDCAFCFGNLLMWCGIYRVEICKIDGLFVSRSINDDGTYAFCFPKGEGDVGAVVSKLENEYGNISFFGLDENDVKSLRAFRGDEYEISFDRDSSDYIYKVSDLSDLPGKKYHQKRNHIAYFEKNYNWSYESIGSANIAECLRMNDEWNEKNIDKVSTGTDKEEIAIKRAFENFDRLGLVGGLLRVDNKVCAYTFGEKLNDSYFCTHVEKAFYDMRGAYPMINREFARRELSGFEFVNREEDLGIEGLRKAKLSYHPCRLSNFYFAEKR